MFFCVMLQPRTLISIVRTCQNVSQLFCEFSSLGCLHEYCMQTIVYKYKADYYIYYVFIDACTCTLSASWLVSACYVTFCIFYDICSFIYTLHCFPAVCMCELLIDVLLCVFGLREVRAFFRLDCELFSYPMRCCVQNQIVPYTFCFILVFLCVLQNSLD